MKFTLNWLKEFVAFDDSPEKLSELLTMAGLEVESVTPLSAIEGGASDWLFEISVTPNRGDCLSVMGLAREVSVLTGNTVTANLAHRDGNTVQSLAGMAIEITDPELCPRYSAKVIEGVRMGQAPVWMRDRLEACGVRALNNVVDVTNYVMLETGQPLHAFDLDRLTDGRIVVRRAGSVKKFITLDGIERELSESDLLICDGEMPIALAGVMGGHNSEVTNQTRRVLLESAHFDPTTIRRTAKRLGLHSEASHRFERGVDPSGTVAAADRATALMAEYAGGSVEAGVLDSYPRPPKISSILLRQESIEKLLGTRIPPDQVEKFLKALGLKIHKRAGQGSLEVLPPTRRTDLTREADLIEDLARLYGYQNIPTTLPILQCAAARADYHLAWERRIRSFLAGEGLVEAINLPFTSEAMNHAFSGLWDGPTSAVPVLNPLVKESAEMRLSLLPGLIDNFRLNLAQQAENFFAYQLGKIFRRQANGEIEEKQCLAGLLFGSRTRKGLRSSGNGSAIGFLDSKGLVEGILDVFHLRESVIWSRAKLSVLHPGRASDLLYDGQKIGHMGESHPNLIDQFGVPAFLPFELDFDKLVQYSPRQIKASSLPRYPAVERDIALVVDQALPSQQIIGCINELGQTLIERIEVFDEYRGASIPEGKKSLAYKISYRANDRTLTDGEVNALHQDLVDHVGKVFTAQRRS
ncbi:MAG: phenylalanine--tRNA ligase subunit beta [Deltaproteobacteria bacterium]|nr:phenylalanine--tRNA ligase subunit beta [Deltaproteobacteria bacterium]